MMKIALASIAAAAVLTTAPLVTPVKAEGVKMAQGVDVQVGPGGDRDYERDYRHGRDDRDGDVTVGEGLGQHVQAAGGGDVARVAEAGFAAEDVVGGVGPGGVRVGPREHCRMVTTTVEREDGRSITRRERRCD